MSTTQVTGAGLDESTGIGTEPPAAAGIIDSKVGEVSQTQLMYRRFKQSKLAIVSLIVLGLLYLSAIFAPFWHRTTRWRWTRRTSTLHRAR